MRMKMLIALLAIGVIVSTSLHFLHARREKYLIQTQKIGDGVYLFFGTGMNALAVVADDGVILVDTMMNGWWGRALEAGLRRVTDKRVTTIINTNSHPSHSGNNHRFGGAGVLVVSHEQTRSRLQGRDNFQGTSARYLPQTTFRDRLTLMRGKERIELYYFGASNTDGDAWVVFPSRRIMHIGDVVKKDEMVEITPGAGGRADSYAETMARGMATIKDVDVVVAGHSHRGSAAPTLTWSELATYQKDAGVLVDAVRHAMSAADNVDAVLSSVHAGARLGHYEAEDVTAAVGVAYAELIAARARSRDRGAEVTSPAAPGLAPQRANR
jgi:glyoxylase-like metal-dependent hydrolase (beta-lactamase superfamily II)